MFWGLIMEPRRRYTQDVTKPFHVSMAAVDISSSDSEPAQVMCGIEGRNYLLCTLQKGKILQCPLDLNFEAGTMISFATNGNSHIHLTGYLADDLSDLDEEVDAQQEGEEVEPEMPGKAKKRRLRSDNGGGGVVGAKKMKTLELLEAINSQESDDEDENFSDLLGSDEDGEEEAQDEQGEEEEDDDDDLDEVEEEEDDDDEDSSLSEDDDDDDDEDEEEVMEQKSKTNGTPLPKKNKQKENQTPAKQKVETPKTDKQKTPKSEKKNQQQKEKTPNQQKQKDTPAKSPDTPQQKKRTVEGGVTIEDIRTGNGAVAKPGKICQVYYEGRLKSSNKVFDATTKGAGFKFRLGKQEVIKGWDIGLNGMKVGGKRRITCPPNMGYGQKGSPPAIPPNSTLIFEIELKNVL